MPKFKTILLICLISLTSLLVRQTLQIQHSCNPMIHWSGELPAECQLAVKTDFDNFDNFSSQTEQELETPQQSSITQNTVKSQPNKITNSAEAIKPKIAQDISQSKPENQSNSVDQFVAQYNEITKSPKITEPKITQDISQSKPENQSNSVGDFVNEHSNDIVGGIAGVAGGVATVAAAGATAAFSMPIAGAVAIGLGIWFLIRSTL